MQRNEEINRYIILEWLNTTLPQTHFTYENICLQFSDGKYFYEILWMYLPEEIKMMRESLIQCNDMLMYCETICKSNNIYFPYSCEDIHQMNIHEDKFLTFLHRFQWELEHWKFENEMKKLDSKIVI